MAKDTGGSIGFLRRKEEYKVEKPYILRYMPQISELDQDNLETDLHLLPLSGIRPHLLTMAFERSRIGTLEFDTGLRGEESVDREMVESTRLLKRRLHQRYR